MKKEMTKKEIKNFMEGLVNEKWKEVRNWKSIIACIEKQTEKTKNDENVLAICVNDKHNLIHEIIELEKLYKTFFGKDMER